MFCPNCKAEYSEGILKCAECKIDLIPELPPEPEESVEYVDLVNLETYPDRIQAELAKGVLSAGGINAIVHGDEFGGYEPALSFSSGVQLLIKREEIEEAKKILNEIEGKA
jgi:hypothetical protein